MYQAVMMQNPIGLLPMRPHHRNPLSTLTPKPDLASSTPVKRGSLFEPSTIDGSYAEEGDLRHRSVHGQSMVLQMRPAVK